MEKSISIRQIAAAVLSSEALTVFSSRELSAFINFSPAVLRRGFNAPCGVGLAGDIARPPLGERGESMVQRGERGTLLWEPFGGLGEALLGWALLGKVHLGLGEMETE